GIGGGAVGRDIHSAWRGRGTGADRAQQRRRPPAHCLASRLRFRPVTRPRLCEWRPPGEGAETHDQRDRTIRDAQDLSAPVAVGGGELLPISTVPTLASPG